MAEELFGDLLIDMTGIDQDKEVPPTDVYMMQVVGFKIGKAGEEAKAPGMPLVNLSLEINDGEWMGRRAFHNVGLPHPNRTAEDNRRCRMNVDKLCEAAGQPLEDGQKFTIQELEDWVLGSVIKCRCEKGLDSNQNPRLDVKAILLD